MFTKSRAIKIRAFLSIKNYYPSCERCIALSLNKGWHGSLSSGEGDLFLGGVR